MRGDARGFTLLEAIVALAILAAAGLALFGALNQSLQMLGRAERSRQIDGALRNALAHVARIDPVREPRGEEALGDFVLRWSAEAVEPPRPGATGFLRAGYYEVGLYRLRLELWRDGALERSADVRRAGYRQVRSPPRL